MCVCDSRMSEPEESGGNLSAVQSISAKLLEVTRLAEKLDAKLCEAGARSQGLNPATGEKTGEDVRDASVGTSRDHEEASDKKADKTEVRFGDSCTQGGPFIFVLRACSTHKSEDFSS